MLGEAEWESTGNIQLQRLLFSKKYIFIFCKRNMYRIVSFFCERKLSRILRVCGDSRKFSLRKSIFKQLDTALVGMMHWFAANL